GDERGETDHATEYSHSGPGSSPGPARLWERVCGEDPERVCGSTGGDELGHHHAGRGHPRVPGAGAAELAGLGGETFVRGAERAAGQVGERIGHATQVDRTVRRRRKEPDGAAGGN